MMLFLATITILFSGYLPIFALAKRFPSQRHIKTSNRVMEKEQKPFVQLPLQSIEDLLLFAVFT